MYCRWFTTPDPDYGTLVGQLYGAAGGEGLFRAYADQLSSRDLWDHRLDWAGLAVYDSGARIRAHAVVQAAKDRPTVYVGFVESVDDRDVAAYLLAAIRQAVETRYPGRPVYLPVNLSIWHSYRFRTMERERLPFETPTQPYYGRLFAGFLPQEEWYASYRMPIYSSLKGSTPSGEYVVREPTPATIRQDLRTVYDLSVRIFESEHSLPGFAEFQAIHSGAASTVDPRYVLIAEDHGRPAGFIYTLKKEQALFVKTLAVLPEHQRQGVARLLYETVCRRVLEEDCRSVYGLTMRADRLITRLLPPDAEKVAEYVLYKET